MFGTKKKKKKKKRKKLGGRTIDCLNASTGWLFPSFIHAS